MLEDTDERRLQDGRHALPNCGLAFWGCSNLHLSPNRHSPRRKYWQTGYKHRDWVDSTFRARPTESVP